MLHSWPFLPFPSLLSRRLSLLQLVDEQDVSPRIFKLESHYFAVGEVSDVFKCKFLTTDGLPKIVSDPTSQLPMPQYLSPRKKVAVKVMRGLTSGEVARQKFRKVSIPSLWHLRVNFRETELQLLGPR